MTDTTPTNTPAWLDQNWIPEGLIDPGPRSRR